MGEGFGYAVEQAAKQRGYENGYKIGYEGQMIKSIITLTETMNWSVKQAMDALEISEDQQDYYTELLKKSKDEKG